MKRSDNRTFSWIDTQSPRLARDQSLSNNKNWKCNSRMKRRPLSFDGYGRLMLTLKLIIARIYLGRHGQSKPRAPLL
jgi:hypothetical protein